MANKKQNKELQKKSKKKSEETELNEYSPRVERIYKIILRTMSWIVGSAIFLVIVLFYFESPVIDSISQVIFYIGFITLILFLIIELVGNNVKNLLSKIIDNNTDAESTINR